MIPVNDESPDLLDTSSLPSRTERWRIRNTDTRATGIPARLLSTLMHLQDGCYDYDDYTLTVLLRTIDWSCLSTVGLGTCFSVATDAKLDSETNVVTHEP
jgi:hypothetical protein